MNWKQKYRSFYYQEAGEPEDIKLNLSTAAFLVIDIQNEYLNRKPLSNPTPSEQKEWDRWTPFHDRMNNIVTPNTKLLLNTFRPSNAEVLFARIACLTEDGRDRSLSQKMPGWNNLLMPKDSKRSQIIDELEPKKDEITVIKTTDSALTGTNLRLILTNLGIQTVIVAGIFTDQCVSSTVRSLADESFQVIVIDDACAAGTDELHEAELTIINHIYCHVLSTQDVISLIN